MWGKAFLNKPTCRQVASDIATDNVSSHKPCGPDLVVFRHGELGQAVLGLLSKGSLEVKVVGWPGQALAAALHDRHREIRPARTAQWLRKTHAHMHMSLELLDTA
jgi:hypothetical protein